MKSNNLLLCLFIFIFICFVQIFLLVIIFGLFFGLVFLPVILSYFGPSVCHSNPLNGYEASSTDDNRRRRLNKHDDITPTDREMISFIQPNENIDTDEKFQKVQMDNN